jgi:TPR repeat protein
MDTTLLAALDDDVDVDAALAAAEERVARLTKLKAARERARTAGDSGAGAPPPRDDDAGGGRDAADDAAAAAEDDEGEDDDDDADSASSDDDDDASSAGPTARERRLFDVEDGDLFCFRYSADLAKAAAEGDQFAQHSLGVAYARGRGVEKDSVRAAHWFAKAAAQGDEDAQLHLGVAYVRGDGVEEDPVRAVHWYAKAAEQGHGQAMCFLGGMYEDGEGVEKDLAQAAHWYRKASERPSEDPGSSWGKEALEALGAAAGAGADAPAAAAAAAVESSAAAADSSAAPAGVQAAAAALVAARYASAAGAAAADAGGAGARGPKPNDALCGVVTKGGEKCAKRGTCWTLCDTHRKQLKRGLDRQAKKGVAKSAIWNAENDEVRERGIKARKTFLAGRKRKREPKKAKSKR